MIEKDFFKIIPYENLIVSEFYGAWNMDVTKDYLKVAFTLIQQNYSEKPYAVLDDCRKWELNTPNAKQFWKETFATANIQLPTHVAYVVGGSGLKSWVIETMTKEAGPFKKVIFESIDDGFKWLESHGHKALHHK